MPKLLVKDRMTREQYEGHDCHLSPDDSCPTCVAWAEQLEHFKDSDCPEGLCDGSGVDDDGRKCLHKINDDADKEANNQ